MDEHTKEALDIVKAQAAVRVMSQDEILEMTKAIAEQLKGFSDNPPSAEEEKQKPAVDPKKAIKEKSVTCLECGKQFKILTKKHLATHGLTPEEYKEKWGYKKGKALVAKSLARDRRKKMESMELWKRRSTKPGGSAKENA